ncbi:hypothetical protein [Halosimplex marinum]|uniref:hypothetical protein n=1 Tax=Halosimplex marinum TaxID=3396620 RepID=UPI003F558B43
MARLTAGPVALVVGLALVTAPLWAPALNATGPTYEYRSPGLSVEDDRIAFADTRPADGLDGVACFSVDVSRRCALAAVLTNGTTVGTGYPGVEADAGYAGELLTAPEEYVAFRGDGRVFERTARYDETADEWVLGLERVDAWDVLSEVAVEPRRDAVRRAVESEFGLAPEPLDEGLVVETNDGFAVVYTAGTRGSPVERPAVERAIEGISVAFGVAILRRRGRGTA